MRERRDGRPCSRARLRSVVVADAEPGAGNGRYDRLSIGAACWTGPSTKLCRQPENRENSYLKPADRSSTMGLNATSQQLTLPTRENAPSAKVRGMSRIRAKRAASVPVKTIGAGIGSEIVWRPFLTSFPTLSASSQLRRANSPLATLVSTSVTVLTTGLRPDNYQEPETTQDLSSKASTPSALGTRPPAHESIGSHQTRTRVWRPPRE